MSIDQLRAAYLADFNRALDHAGILGLSEGTIQRLKDLKTVLVRDDRLLQELLFIIHVTEAKKNEEFDFGGY
jgi:hypothetical protein